MTKITTTPSLYYVESPLRRVSTASSLYYVESRLTVGIELATFGCERDVLALGYSHPPLQNHLLILLYLWFNGEILLLMFRQLNNLVEKYSFLNA